MNDSPIRDETSLHALLECYRESGETATETDSKTAIPRDGCSSPGDNALHGAPGSGSRARRLVAASACDATPGEV